MNKLFSLDAYKDSNGLFRLGKNETRDEAIRLGVELTSRYVNKKYSQRLKDYGTYFEVDESVNYNDINKAFSNALIQYTYGNKDLKVEDVKNVLSTPGRFNTAERERFYEIITSVQTVVTPAITSAFTSMYNEIQNIGWGDTAKFEIESNEILKVKKSAEGVRFTTEEELYRNEVTVPTENLSISFSVDFIKLATNMVDFGERFFKAAQGFANYFEITAYNQFRAFAAQVPAQYKANGLTTTNVDLVSMAVSGANGGANVSLIGTLPVLREIVPQNDFFKPALGEEWVKQGFIGVHAGSPVVKMDNMLDPTTVNNPSGAAKFMKDNDRLFVFPFIGKKPVKTVFEGSVYSVDLNAIQTSDKTERAVITYKAGVKFIPEFHMGLISV